jgi:ArsR family transcriptional regulator
MRRYAYRDKVLEMRELVKTFKALSDETRLRILNLLLERECCVCEVMQALNISQPRASRNLSALYNAGFLNLRREGLWALYSIDKEGLKEHYTDLVEAVRKALEGNETALQDRQRLRNAKRIGPSCVRAITN